MNRARRLLLRSAVAAAAAASTSIAMADASSVERAATLGGRIIGAAKTCGINSERIRRTSERMLSVMGANAASPTEKQAAKALFVASQTAGAEEVRSERSMCRGIHVEFSEMEVKLGSAPATDGERAVAKRGIPALGALKQDTATRRE